jgi:hypothetical protein
MAQKENRYPTDGCCNYFDMAHQTYCAKITANNDRCEIHQAMYSGPTVTPTSPLAQRLAVAFRNNRDKELFNSLAMSKEKSVATELALVRVQLAQIHEAIQECDDEFMVDKLEAKADKKIGVINQLTNTQHTITGNDLSADLGNITVKIVVDDKTKINLHEDLPELEA